MRTYSILNSSSPRLRLGLLACALGLSFAASSASAQDYGRYGSDVSYRAGGPEEIDIYAPRRYQPARSAIGAPIVNVSLSQPVRYDDLDLASDWGARKLNERIRYSARVLCQKIHLRYPITEGDRDSCYRETVADAQDQADDAIDHARYGDY